MVKKIDKEDLLKHIDDKEKIIVLRQVIDKIESVSINHSVLTTDFLDPYEVKLSQSILNRFLEIAYSIDGGYGDSERAIIYIYPEYLFAPELEEIIKFQIKSDNVIEHKDVLGSLIGLGIDRKKVGDILIYEDTSIFFVKREIADFIEFNLDKIGNNKVNPIRINEFDFPEKEYTESTKIISSLRLDTVIGAVYNLSRSNAQSLIDADKVKHNFKKEDKSSIILNDGDVVSVRKYGRFIVDKIEGRTKKEKYRVKIKIPK